MVRTLVHSCGVGRDQIVVLSPYRAQCHVIREGLADRELSDVPVISIIKSQGRKWYFVNRIIFLFRSHLVSYCPSVDCFAVLIKRSS